MDGVDEEQIKRMCANTTISTVVTIIACLLRIRARRKSICYAPREDKMRRIYCRNAHFKRVFEGYSDSCRSYIRMRPKLFFKLADIL